MLAVPTELGVYYTLNGQIHTENSEPIQPLHVVDLSNNYGPMPGVIFIGGTYHDVPGFDPVVEGRAISIVCKMSRPRNRRLMSLAGIL